MCYIEVWLIDMVKCLFDGLDENVVDWWEIYDGEDCELIVLLGGFFNFLGNGFLGIVVGMVILILLYNVFELCNVC